MNITNRINKDEALRFKGFKIKSFEEYLAARCLFNNDFIEQAVVLSNTCLEKQIKAALVGCNVKFNYTHDAQHLLQLLTNVLPNLAVNINPKYLKRITQIYNYRYYENTKTSRIANLNYTLSRVFYLSELDYSFSILERASNLIEPNNEQMESGYNFGIQHETPWLYLNNYILLNKEKMEIFDGHDLLIQSVIDDGIELYTAERRGPTDNFYNNFEMDGIKINGNILTAVTSE